MNLEINSKQRRVSHTEIVTIRQIAHKLIDHLTAVVGYTEIAQRQRKLGRGVCVELAKIEAAAQRAIVMVRQANDRLKSLEETNP